MKNIKINENSMTFTLEGVPVAMANALRRTILGGIKSFAINNFTFHRNTGVLNDDILRQRLGLLPLSDANIRKIEYSNLEITFNHKNVENYIKSYYCSDFQIKNTKTGNFVKNSNIFVYPNILFVQLAGDQELNLTCKVSELIADVRSCPVSVCYYRFKKDEDRILEIREWMLRLREIGDKLIETGKGIEILEKRIAEYPFRDTLREIDTNIDEIKTILDTDKNARHLGLKIQEFHIPTYDNSYSDRIYIKNIYDFYLESIGTMTPKLIVKSAIETLGDKISSVLKDLKDDIIVIRKADVGFESYDINLIDQDDTLGNLISTYAYADDRFSYSGYQIPHPLNNLMLVRLALKNNNTIDNLKKVFNDLLVHIRKEVFQLV